MTPGTPLRTGKLLALRLAHRLGLNALVFHSAWRAKRLLILAYHGTSLDDEHLWSPLLYMAPAALRRHLELLGRTGCNVLPLDDAIHRLYAGTLPPRSVALTVDDGSFDFYKLGFPIFESLGLPVTCYLTTYYARFNRPVYDTMQSYLLWKGRGGKLFWPEVLGTSDPLELSASGLEFAMRRLLAWPGECGLSGAEKDVLLSGLAERLGIDYQDICRRRLLHLMTMEEARELAARGVDFQLHTHRHGVSFEKSRFAREIADNREALHSLRSGAPAVHFCYPGGVHRPEFLSWLAEWGIASATTCQADFASPGTPPLLLPRLLDTSILSEDEFVGWLAGIAAFLPQRRFPEAAGQFLEARLGTRPSAACAAGR